MLPDVPTPTQTSPDVPRLPPIFRVLSPGFFLNFSFLKNIQNFKFFKIFLENYPNFKKYPKLKKIKFF